MSERARLPDVTGDLTLAEAHGTLSCRVRGGDLDVHATGRLSAPMMSRAIEIARAALDREGAVRVFYDWSQVDTYDVAAREIALEFTAGEQGVQAVHVLAANPLVVTGVALDQAVVGDRVVLHRARSTFDSARAACRLTHEAPAPALSQPRQERVRTRSGTALVLSAGAVVGDRYRVIRALGAGGSGGVYLCMDEDLERRTAIKLLRAGRRSLDDTRHEARAMAALRHENVAAIYTLGTHEAFPFLAMEYVEGSSLAEIARSHRERRSFVPLGSALHMLAQVARGLGAMHAHGLVHRDVKPENIVIETGTGRTVLVDLGMSRAPRDAGSPAETLEGTPGFIAPELWMGGPATAKSDVYAFGMAAYELLAGTPPFEGEHNVMRWMQQHLVVAPHPLSSHRPELAVLDAVILPTLAKDPADRPSSCAALSTQLGRAPAEVGAATTPRRTGTIRALIAHPDEAAARHVARVIREAFAHLSPSVTCCVEGAGAVHTSGASPDFVILAGRLPDMHGIELLAQLRARWPGPRLEIVIDPGSHDEEWRFRALGVEHFVRGLDDEAIMAKVRALSLAESWA